MIVGHELEWDSLLSLQFRQKHSRLGDRQSVWRRLGQDADEPQLRDRAGEHLVTRSFPETQHPQGNPVMKLVLAKAQCDQRVHIEKISHGKLDRIS